MSSNKNNFNDPMYHLGFMPIDSPLLPNGPLDQKGPSIGDVFGTPSMPNLPSMPDTPNYNTNRPTKPAHEDATARPQDQADNPLMSDTKIKVVIGLATFAIIYTLATKK